MSHFNILVFNKNLLESKPDFLHQLSSFYCNIWRFDPNFAEYKQCPTCSKYYSESDYNEKNIRDCQICGTTLVEAWVEEEVAETIRRLADLGQNFFGAVAVVPNENDRIVGFVWGYNKPLSEVKDQTVLKRVLNSNGFTPYFNEIASDPNYRLKGAGSALCKSLVSWMKENNPDIPGYLHTHESSPARRLFERAGYSFLCYDEAMGAGRIFMSVDFCKNLTPENL